MVGLFLNRVIVGGNHDQNLKCDSRRNWLILILRLILGVQFLISTTRYGDLGPISRIKVKATFLINIYFSIEPYF